MQAFHYLIIFIKEHITNSPELKVVVNIVVVLQLNSSMVGTYFSKMFWLIDQSLSIKTVRVKLEEIPKWLGHTQYAKAGSGRIPQKSGKWLSPGKVAR